MRKYLTEFIGTFLFVLTVGMVVIDPGGSGPLAAIPIGAALMVLVYAGGHVSGGHYNPAVTLAVWLRGRCPVSDVPFYWGAQILGALLASQLVMFLKGDPTVTPANIVIGRALLSEFIGTFALAYVVLNVATAKANAGNSFYGLAIGFTVVVMAFSHGPVSGGAFNPAIATGIIVMHIEKFANYWVYLAGDFAGAALAAVTFKFINPEDK